MIGEGSVEVELQQWEAKRVWRGADKAMELTSLLGVDAAAMPAVGLRLSLASRWS
jgi:hypothetical protein